MNSGDEVLNIVVFGSAVAVGGIVICKDAGKELTSRAEDDASGGSASEKA